MRSGKKAAAKKKQEEPVSPDFSRSGLCDYLGIYRESCCLVCTAKASAAPTLTLAHFFRAFFFAAGINNTDRGYKMSAIALPYHAGKSRYARASSIGPPSN